MKKIALLLAAMMLITGSAYGAISDGTTHWLMTVPEQTVSTYIKVYAWAPGGTVVTGTSLFTTMLYQESWITKSFDLTITGSVVTFQETSPGVTYDAGLEVVTAYLYGEGTYTGTGPYTVTTNATTGQLIDKWEEWIYFESTIDPFTMNAAEDTITNGVTTQLVGAPAWGWTPMSWTAVKVPVPAAFGLLAAGIIGLVAFRSKNNK